MARFFGSAATRTSNLGRDAFDLEAPDALTSAKAPPASTALPIGEPVDFTSTSFDFLSNMPDDFAMRCACASCMEAANKWAEKNEAAAASLANGPQFLPGVAGDDIADDTSTTRTLELQEGQSVTAAIEHLADQDYFRVGMSAGVKYEFKLEAIDTSMLGPDLLLEVRDAAGNLLVSLDSSGAGATENFTYTATSSGTFYLNVKSYLDASIGQYKLTGSISNDPPNPAGETPLDSINWGGNSRRVDTDGVVQNGKQVIHYYFAKPGETYDSSLGPVAALQWADFAKAGMRQAFDSYESIINVTYVEVTTAAAADFVLVANATAPALLGRMSPPGEAQEGQGEFNTLAESWTAASTTRGGFGHITLIHELGHGHGLAHPHDTGGGSGVMRGVTGDLATGYTNGDFGLNSGVYTTMSYNDGWDGGPNGRSPSDDYGFQGTLMAFDIALLQTKYGANTTFNNGDNTYVIRDVNASGTFYATIWDTGGSDTIRYDGARNAVIDLRAATLLYEEGGGGRVSYAAGIHGGFTIANGVTIENVQGGNGSDRIVGNEAANGLYGNGGADDISGGGGADRIAGFTGDDLLAGGDGDDELHGEDGADGVYGGTGADQMYGGAGNDRMAGWTGDDFVVGGTGDDELHGEDGNDGLYGGEGADRHFGGAGNDRIAGWLGDDVIDGGAGDDEIYGEDGADLITGGAGADVFAYFLASHSRAFSADTILDFNAADGDRVDLRGIDANTLIAGDQNFTLVSGYSGQAGQAVLFYDPNRGATVLEGDTNGDGISDFILQIAGNHVADAGAFLI